MKKYGILVLVWMAFVQLSMAQTGGSKSQAKIETHKKAFIEERVAMNEEDKKSFWAVYNKFSKKRRDLRIDRQQNRLSMQKSELSEQEAGSVIKKEIEIKLKEAKLEESYISELQKTFDNTVVLELLKAENEFNRLVLKRISNERRKQGGR